MALDKVEPHISLLSFVSSLSFCLQVGLDSVCLDLLVWQHMPSSRVLLVMVVSLVAFDKLCMVEDASHCALSNPSTCSSLFASVNSVWVHGDHVLEMSWFRVQMICSIGWIFRYGRVK